MKQYPDESYLDSMILISKIRLPGSSLTWWRDSSAAPWEASPSSSRRRREKGGITTCPMCPSSRRWVAHVRWISALFDQDLSCDLRYLLLHKCQSTTCRTSPFTHHIWCKCLEACSQTLIYRLYFSVLTLNIFRMSSRLTPRPRRCWRWWTSSLSPASRWPLLVSTAIL